jgi:hypothetical protein
LSLSPNRSIFLRHRKMSHVDRSSLAAAILESLLARLQYGQSTHPKLVAALLSQADYLTRRKAGL